MTLSERIITIAMCVLGTVATRLIPFLLFSGKKGAPRFIGYLGKSLPPAVFAMLLVYALRGMSLTTYSYGIPETVALALTCGVHIWKRQMLLSIAVGTLSYMLLVQLVFV